MDLVSKKAVCILSGGMDSTLCATMAVKSGYEVVALHFDYNQRTMQKERLAFHGVCDALNINKRFVLDVSFISDIGGNALTDSNIVIPKSGLSQNVPVTYVPYRNGIFISIAAALAERVGADAIYIGVVQEDSSGYPDCTEEFIQNQIKTINIGTATKNKIQIITPLVHLSKSEIVAKSIELNAPIDRTWSCYDSEDEACGLCDSCRLRLRGFEMAGLKDPIKYANLK